MTSQLNKIADYWNQRSFGYSLDNQEELLHDQEKWIELINRYLKINKGMKVLDLGCGPGFFLLCLQIMDVKLSVLITVTKCWRKQEIMQVNLKRMSNFKKWMFKI